MAELNESQKVSDPFHYYDYKMQGRHTQTTFPEPKEGAYELWPSQPKKGALDQE